MKKNAGKISNLFEITKKNRYAARTVGSLTAVVSSIKYRQGDFKNVGKIAQAVAEMKAAGLDIESVNTAHANGLFRSFFITHIIGTISEEE